MIEPNHERLSVRRQCDLLGLNRAGYYYQAASESNLNLELMRKIDEQYLKTPYYGWPRMTAHLHRQGYAVWSWEDQALRRAFDWLHDQADFPATDPVAGSDDGWQPYIPNYFYATTYPTNEQSIGKNMAWTAWAFGERP